MSDNVNATVDGFFSGIINTVFNFAESIWRVISRPRDGVIVLIRRFRSKSGTQISPKAFVLLAAVIGLSAAPAILALMDKSDAADRPPVLGVDQQGLIHSLYEGARENVDSGTVFASTIAALIGVACLFILHRIFLHFAFATDTRREIGSDLLLYWTGAQVTIWVIFGLLGRIARSVFHIPDAAIPVLSTGSAIALAVLSLPSIALLARRARLPLLGQRAQGGSETWRRPEASASTVFLFLIAANAATAASIYIARGVFDEIKPQASPFYRLYVDSCSRVPLDPNSVHQPGQEIVEARVLVTNLSGAPRVLTDGDLCLAIGSDLTTAAPEMYATLRHTGECPSQSDGPFSHPARLHDSPMMLDSGRSALLHIDAFFSAAEIEGVAADQAECLAITSRPSRVNSEDLSPP